MIKSLIIGLLYPLIILLSGWLSLLFSFISISFGSKIPFLYFFLGIDFGIGKIFKNTEFWPGFLLGVILSIFIVLQSNKFNEKAKYFNMVSTCASGFIIGSLIGLIIGLF